MPPADGLSRSYPARRFWVLQSILAALGFGAFGVALWIHPEWTTGWATVGRVALASLCVGLSVMGFVYTVSRLFLGAVTVSAEGLYSPWPWLPRGRSIRWADVTDITLRPLPAGYAQLVLHLHDGKKSYLPLGGIRSVRELQLDIHQSWVTATGRELPYELTVWAGPSPPPRKVVVSFYILSALLGAAASSWGIRLLFCEGSECRGGVALVALVICGALAGLVVCRLVRLRLRRRRELRQG